MSSFPPRFFLPPNEEVMREDRMAPAWGVERVVMSLLFVVIVWGAAIVALSMRDFAQRDTLVMVVVVVAVFQLAATSLYAWRRVATSEYVVTDESVFGRRGRLLLRLETTSLDRVTDLHVHTSLMGRLFGFSSLSIRTAGGGIAYYGLRDAYIVRSAIHDARHVFIAKLLREAGRSEESGPKAAASACQCPRCDHVFSVIGSPPIDVECPNCHEAGTLFAEAST